MTLRELRLWHWRKARAATKKIDYYESCPPSRYARQQANRHKCTHSFHMKAVQALNDVVSGTAEQDDFNQSGEFINVEG